MSQGRCPLGSLNSSFLAFDGFVNNPGPDVSVQSYVDLQSESGLPAGVCKPGQSPLASLNSSKGMVKRIHLHVVRPATLIRVP